MDNIYIKDEYITLGQFLKLTNLFDSGGFIKNYLREEGVFVNETLEHRRGRKLFDNDVVKFNEEHIFKVRVQK